MRNSFIHCLSAEWIKKRRSFSSWLVIIGGCFVPLILAIMFLIYPNNLIALHRSDQFWHTLQLKSWETMSIILLPMGIVLAVSLITQLEFKNNTWKQLHTAPVPFSSIYFSKLAIILLMLLQLFVLFNIATYISVWIPALLRSNIPIPVHAMDAVSILKENAAYFIACLPLVALQYLISLQFKNFLLPIGAGLALVVGSIIANSWKYVYLLPPAYPALHFQEAAGGNKHATHNLLLWAVGYFVCFVVAGYILYVNKKEKG